MATEKKANNIMKQTIITSTQLQAPLPIAIGINRGRGTKKYIAPEIETIKLDNEISLALGSAPPFGPDEVNNIIPNRFNNNPFNDRMA